MSDKKISVSIVTPEEHVYDGEVNFISIPAKSGSLGILPGHLPIVCNLGVGIVKLATDRETEYIGVCWGFMEFINNRANILTERAIVTNYEQRRKTIEELKKKHDIIQEITEDTKKVIQAIASMQRLKK